MVLTRLMRPRHYDSYVRPRFVAKDHGMHAHRHLTQCVSTEKSCTLRTEILTTCDMGRVLADYHNKLTAYTCEMDLHRQEKRTTSTREKSSIVQKAHTQLIGHSPNPDIPTLPRNPPLVRMRGVSMHFFVTRSAADAMSNRDAKSDSLVVAGTTSITH